MVYDYVLYALYGMRSDFYVSNCTTCANDTKYFELDARHFRATWRTVSRATTTGRRFVFFNMTATISGYLPDAIYYCFFIPQKSKVAWAKHYLPFLAKKN